MAWYIDSNNNLVPVPSGNEPLPKPMLTYDSCGLILMTKIYWGWDMDM